MNTSSFGYLARQGVKNIWLNRLMSFASVGILVACFILIGGAALVTLNVRDLFIEIETQNEIEIFLSDEASVQDVYSMRTEIAALDGVSTVEYISKEQALEEQKSFMGESGDLLEGLEDDNPLPNLLRVTMDDLTKLRTLTDKCEAMPLVDSVSAPVNLAETLTGLQRGMLILGGIIIGILLVASLVVISNTIRLTVYARRKEISIMKYVGATNAFIRLPFVVEGIVIGFIAAVLSFGTVYFIYSSLVTLVSESTVAWIKNLSISLIPFGSVWYWFAGGFAVSGMIIGAFGSSVSINKYLEV